MTPPNCPKCGDNRQVWANQITGRLTCHRIHCHTEIEMTPHPHADFLRAIADGVPITDFEAKHHDDGPNFWTDAGDYLFAIVIEPSRVDIQRKPQTHVVNGFTVPKPLRDAPELGQFYYVPDFAEDQFAPNLYPWSADGIDERFLSRGLVHLTKEAAIANAKAMCGIDPEAV